MGQLINWVAAIVGVAALVYLLFAVIRPDRF